MESLEQGHKALIEIVHGAAELFQYPVDIRHSDAQLAFFGSKNSPHAKMLFLHFNVGSLLDGNHFDTGIYNENIAQDRIGNFIYSMLVQVLGLDLYGNNYALIGLMDRNIKTKDVK